MEANTALSKQWNIVVAASCCEDAFKLGKRIWSKLVGRLMEIIPGRKSVGSCKILKAGADSNHLTGK